jgi:hypothetical protein
VKLGGRDIEVVATCAKENTGAKNKIVKIIAFGFFIYEGRGL